MSKIPLKKIIINKINSSKNIDNKKSPLYSSQIGNKYINEDYYNMNNLFLNSKDNNNKNDLIYDLENKENYCIQNSKIKRINQIKDLNYYLLQKRKNNSNNNEYNISSHEKLDTSNPYKNYKSTNNKFLYSKYIQNNNANNNNYEINRRNKVSNEFNNKNNDGYFTSRLPKNNINKYILDYINSNKILLNNPLTEREKGNLNLYLDNHYFLPENKSDKKTLILDLDETLIHSSLKPFNIKNEVKIKINTTTTTSKNKLSQNNQYTIHMLKRPYVGLFLSIICDIFEVVVFTASISDYANSILNEIDTEKKIKYRLYREHCIKIDKDRYIKNLYCLGRELKNVIIIDNNPFSYSLNMENGLPISTWETNQSDNELIKLIPLLQYLSKSEISDVRPIIKKVVINNKINYNEINKLINYKNKIANIFFKLNDNNIINRKENQIYKNINYRKRIKIINKNINRSINSINNKLKLNDLNKYNVNNNSNIYNSQKILKSISINKDNELSSKKLKTINTNNHRGKSENRKNSNENTLIRNGKLNLSFKYLLNNKGQNNCTTSLTQNNDKNIKNKFKLRTCSSMVGNKNKDINNSIPNNYNISRNKKFIKNKNIIYLGKDDSSKKSLVKNYSDYGCNINKNTIKERNVDEFTNSKFPTLKTLFYHKIFSNNTNKYKNKKKNNYSPSNKKEQVLTESKSQRQIGFNFIKANNNINTENNKTQNSSLNNYLNNNFNLKIFDDNLNSFIIRLRMNGQKKQLSESKIRKRKLLTNKTSDINYDTNRELKDSIIKHSFSFLNNKNKIKDYVNIINSN